MSDFLSNFLVEILILWSIQMVSPRPHCEIPCWALIFFISLCVCVYVLLEAAAGESRILLCMCLVSFVSTEFLIKLSCITKQKTFQRSSNTHSIILSSSKFNHTKIWCRLLGKYFNPHSPLLPLSAFLSSIYGVCHRHGII